MSDNLTILIVVLIFLNIFSFVIMGYDKKRARLGKWRVAERTLFFIAFIGGATGVYCGMRFFRHKTKHLQFVLGIPGLIGVNFIMYFILVKWFHGLTN